jgi:hypothetical protein
MGAFRRSALIPRKPEMLVPVEENQSHAALAA